MRGVLGTKISIRKLHHGGLSTHLMSCVICHSLLWKKHQENGCFIPLVTLILSLLQRKKVNKGIVFHVKQSICSLCKFLHSLYICYVHII